MICHLPTRHHFLLFSSPQTGPLLSAAPPRPFTYTAPQLRSRPIAPYIQKHSFEEGEGEMEPGRVLSSRGRPASVAPIAEADLLLISVGKDVGFARKFREHSVQPAQVVVKLLFQVLLAGVRALQVAQIH